MTAACGKCRSAGLTWLERLPRRWPPRIVGGVLVTVPPEPRREPPVADVRRLVA